MNVTPVKSTGLNHPPEISLGSRGASGDREFIFVRKDGRRLSGISKAHLLGIRATYDAQRDRLSLRLPDGTVVDGDARAVGDTLDVEFYGGRVLPVRMLGGGLATATSRLLDPPVSLGRLVHPEGEAVGDPVSLLAIQSVEELARRVGVERIDPRRFRMLIELDGTAPFEEETWIGRPIHVGEAVLGVTRPVSRCVMTTLQPDTGAQDLPVLDLLAAHKGRNPNGSFTLGVYANVVRPGVVKVGDEVTPH